MEMINTDIKGIVYMRSGEEFNRARRKAFVQDTIAKISGHNLDLLSFEEVVSKLKLRHKATIERGLQDIPLDQIAGSCGRYTDFTRTFIPRRAGRDKERWRQIYTLATTGQGFPPILVYKIDQVYFVKDGNHRVSVARELGWKTIQAMVSELPTIFELKPDIRPDQLLIKEECAFFLNKTRLHQIRPSADVVFTVPGRYYRLLKQISVFKFYLSRQKGKDVSDTEVVVEWYDKFYKPMIKHIKISGVMKLFPHRTPDDLLVWMIDHQTKLRRKLELGEGGYVNEKREFLAYLDSLNPLKVAKLEVEDKLKEVFGKEDQLEAEN